MPKAHPLIKDRDWCRPGHVIFVSFPSSFPFTRIRPSASRHARPFRPRVFGRRKTENRGAHHIVCRRCAKTKKMAIKAEIENNFVYYFKNSKCCHVPLLSSPPVVSGSKGLVFPGSISSSIVKLYFRSKYVIFITVSEYKTKFQSLKRISSQQNQKGIFPQLHTSFGKLSDFSKDCNNQKKLVKFDRFSSGFVRLYNFKASLVFSKF